MTVDTSLPIGQVAVLRDAEGALAVAEELAGTFRAAADRLDRSREVPVEELTALAESGLLGIRVPREFGGAGVSYETVVRVFVILSRASGSLGQVPQNHFHLIEPVFTDGTDEQKRHFAAEILAGHRFGNAQAERGSRPVLSLPATTLRETGNGTVVLDGDKYYSSGALTAHWIPVQAATESGEFSLTYVPRDAPGLSVVDDWDAMGQRSTHSGTVRLRGVEVPELFSLRPFDGHHRKNTFPPYATVIHAAIDVGIGLGVLERGVDLLHDIARPWRTSQVERAVDDPLTAYRLGKLGTHVHASEQLLYEAARRLDHADDVRTEAEYERAAVTVAEASAFASESAERLASELFEFVGARSTSDSLNFHRYWRDVRTHSTHDPARWKYHRAGQYFLGSSS
ncbi:acyl-CoA dehydrogenase family protein [Rhodococcoides kyotonense]|uniref:Dibenzothiophene monooxygenase n=1 Tax=Rhodococcoides kyotonense TaxID=398843 RepID=A0A239JVW2_9NOCA|nr:acyl-CoA dehydrogenase family protein [Rhodococcus kyotonensis]SNT10011.1 sulfur acquisition oxidoreductase, SfnB family [Rhodococcus kyotonensis]